MELVEVKIEPTEENVWNEEIVHNLEFVKTEEPLHQIKKENNDEACGSSKDDFQYVTNISEGQLAESGVQVIQESSSQAVGNLIYLQLSNGTYMAQQCIIIPPSNTSNNVQVSKDVGQSSSTNVKSDDKNLYECRFCEIQTPDVGDYVDHLRIHKGEKRFECHICNYKFHRKSALLRHIQTHPSKMTYECHICNHRVATKASLFEHVATHTTTTPYRCQLCEYKTSRRTDLLTHLQTHADLYVCPFCNHRGGNKFSNKKGLCAHILTAHSNKYHKCSTCK